MLRYKKLIPPTAYQGGKYRIAGEILKHIRIPEGAVFCDLCCGSGAISLSLISNGFNPKNIIMVDSGMYGLFWESIAKNMFDLDVFFRFLKNVPSDSKLISDYLKDLASRPCPLDDRVYVFLILQAGAFGSKSIGYKNDMWTNVSFRKYWEPTLTSNRRSHVNPMMPMPKSLYRRVAAIVNCCSGINAYHCKVQDVELTKNMVVYLDPPYKNTTGYPVQQFDFVHFAHNAPCPVYFSEAVPVSENNVLISSGRKKGGISGYRGVNNINKEYLSFLNLSDEN